MKRLKSAFATALSLLLATQSVQALPSTGAASQASFHISLPSSMGYVTSVYSPSPKATTDMPDFIFIQDLHVNRSVQFAISKILKRLKTQGFLPHRLAVEGATGPVDIGSMQRYADPLIRKEASDYLLQQGEMPGAIHFVVTEGEGDLFGIETDEYYKANLDMFRRSYQGRTELRAELEKIKAILPKLKKEATSRDNASILEKDMESVSQLLNNQVIPDELPATLRRAAEAIEHLKLVLPTKQMSSRPVVGPGRHTAGVRPKSVGSMDPRPGTAGDDVLVESLSASVNFYSLALLRNDELFKNALVVRQLGKQTTTIVITGGFHTQALTDLCKQKGLSYAVITPTVRRHNKVDEKLYVERLLGHHLTPEQVATGQNWTAMMLQPTWNMVTELFASTASSFAWKRKNVVRSVVAPVAFVIACGMGMASCGGQSMISPSPTPVPTPTSELSPTPTPTPAASPAPLPATLLFRDDFNGTTLGPDWVIPSGAGTFLRSPFQEGASGPERTQLRPPTQPIEVSNGALHLRLDTYNSSANIQGDSFLGSEVDTRQVFSVGTGLSFKARARFVGNVPGGLVGALFGYALRGNVRDESDFELLSNDIGRNGVWTNLFKAEGFSSTGRAQYAPGARLTEFTEYEVRWYPDRLQWYVNGQLVREERSGIPDQPMTIRLNFWAPSESFSQAYNSSLRPATSSAGNQTFFFDFDWLEINRLPPLSSEANTFRFKEASGSAGEPPVTNQEAAGVHHPMGQEATRHADFIRVRGTNVAPLRGAAAQPIAFSEMNKLFARAAQPLPLADQIINAIIARPRAQTLSESPGVSAATANAVVFNNSLASGKGLTNTAELTPEFLLNGAPGKLVLIIDSPRLMQSARITFKSDKKEQYLSLEPGPDGKPTFGGELAYPLQSMTRDAQGKIRFELQIPLKGFSGVIHATVVTPTPSKVSALSEMKAPGSSPAQASTESKPDDVSPKKGASSQISPSSLFVRFLQSLNPFVTLNAQTVANQTQIPPTVPVLPLPNGQILVETFASGPEFISESRGQGGITFGQNFDARQVYNDDFIVVQLQSKPNRIIPVLDVEITIGDAPDLHIYRFVMTKGTLGWKTEPMDTGTQSGSYIRSDDPTVRYQTIIQEMANVDGSRNLMLAFPVSNLKEYAEKEEKPITGIRVSLPGDDVPAGYQIRTFQVQPEPPKKGAEARPSGRQTIYSEQGFSVHQLLNFMLGGMILAAFAGILAPVLSLSEYFKMSSIAVVISFATVGAFLQWKSRQNERAVTLSRVREGLSRVHQSAGTTASSIVARFSGPLDWIHDKETRRRTSEKLSDMAQRAALAIAA